MAQSIFERYGGFAFVSHVVSEFYRKVVDSTSSPTTSTASTCEPSSTIRPSSSPSSWAVPPYDLFGSGVNLAARMETASEPMQITMTEDTAKLLADDFVLSEIGEAEIKGFGSQRLFRLESEVRSLRL